ncbi:MAG TPA: hypothetical protein VFV80_02040 [Geminicoccaceae bacterium]|nr:hypothetical protein [Geminicoccaceae bacterium]
MSDAEKVQYHLWYLHAMEALDAGIRLILKAINGGLTREQQGRADLALLQLKGEKKQQEDRHRAFVREREGRIRPPSPEHVARASQLADDIDQAIAGSQAVSASLALVDGALELFNETQNVPAPVEPAG